MSRKDEELVWVDKEFAEKLKKLETAKATREQQERVFDEYISAVTASVRSDFKANLENLEEDAAIFIGLCLKTRQAFEKAKNEHLEASYALWEKFDTEIPSVKKKTEAVVAELKPILDMVKAIDAGIKNIDIMRFERLLECLRAMASLYGQERPMLEFLVNNFKRAGAE